MAEKLSVVKISGKIIDDPKKLKGFLQDFASITYCKILVHGGGVEIDNLMNRHRMPIKKIDGKRITDLGALCATLIECTKLNTYIVETLKNLTFVPFLTEDEQPRFVGLTEPGTYINSTKRKIIHNPDGTKTNYQYVGDVAWQLVDTDAINGILKSHSTLGAWATPVIPPITFDAKNKLFLNSNADGVATAIAAAMSVQKHYETELVFCSDVAGVLRDVNNPKSLIENIDSETYVDLRKDGTISGGMIPKLESAFKAINSGVHSVKICSTISGRGTTITR